MNLERIIFQTILHVARLPSLFCAMVGVKICKKINLRLIMPEHRLLLQSGQMLFVQSHVIDESGHET